MKLFEGLNTFYCAALCAGVLAAWPSHLLSQTVPTNLNLQKITVATGTATYEASCGISRLAITDFTRKRSPISFQCDQRFHLKPIAIFTRFRSANPSR